MINVWGQKFISNEQELIPILKNITLRSKKQLAYLDSKLYYCKKDSKNWLELQDSIGQEIKKWADKVRKLGCYPISIGKVRYTTTKGEQVLWVYDTGELIKH